MLGEMAFQLGLSIEQLYFALIASVILNVLYFKYIGFPFMDKHEKKIAPYAPFIVISTIFLALLYFEQYIVIVIAVIWSGFIKIVLNSEKYPRLNKVIDFIFQGKK